MNETDQTRKIMGLIVPYRAVAAIWTNQATPVLYLCGHPFHVFRVHCIVLPANGKGGNFYLWQVLATVPFSQTARYAKLRRALHNGIKLCVQMRKGAQYGFRIRLYAAKMFVIKIRHQQLHVFWVGKIATR